MARVRSVSGRRSWLTDNACTLADECACNDVTPPTYLGYLSISVVLRQRNFYSKLTFLWSRVAGESGLISVARRDVSNGSDPTFVKGQRHICEDELTGAQWTRGTVSHTVRTRH